ncbi:MAG: rhomboid family intramembrane serine protease [Catenulisporales bacterium]|nr:rhomboid family intramembrane serine protease [Catenulisporales bacterium]
MVIPIHDKNPVSRAPVATYGLIVANVAVFLAGPIAFAGPDPGPARKARENAYLYHYGAIPAQLLSGHGNPLWPVFTAIFVHAGWIHLLGNMLFLYVFGNNVEDHFGRAHFLLFYLAAGVVSTYAFAWANQTATGPLVGASGAIAAVLGAYAYLFPYTRVTLLVPFLWFLPLRVPAWLVLGFWFVMQLPEFQQTIGVSSSSDIAYFAHVSGFVLGLLYAALVIGRGPSGPARVEPLAPPAVPPHLAPDYRTADPEDPYGQYHR